MKNIIDKKYRFIKSKLKINDLVTFKARHRGRKSISTVEARVVKIQRTKLLAEEIYNSGHIQESVNIDFYAGDFTDKLRILRKDVPIYVYCRSGGRSFSAAKKMQGLGFVKVYNLSGGIGSWNAEDYGTIKSKEEETISQPTFTVLEIDNILKTNEIVLIDFSTEWCIPCKKMKPVIQQIKKESPNVTVLFIDAEVNKELVKRHQIKGVPVFLVFKNAQEVFRHVGVISKAELLKQLK